MKKNLELSLRARLLNLAKKNRTNLDFLVLRYMQEKLLKRISLSRYIENFVLKGGLFFLLFDNLNPRVTKDIDFLGLDINNSEENIKNIFTKIVSIDVNDGLIFNKDKITTEIIKKDANYKGIRVNIICSLGKIVKKIQIDVGSGDKVYPKVKKVNFPSLLDQEIKNLIAYSMETVIAEKFEAMIKLSYLNSRMKDFYDIYNIISSYNLNGNDVKNAIQITLQNRNTKLESNLVIFKDDFYNSRDKQKQWTSFIKNINAPKLEFEFIIQLLKIFLEHPISCILNSKNSDMNWEHKTNKWD